MFPFANVPQILSGLYNLGKLHLRVLLYSGPGCCFNLCTCGGKRVEWDLARDLVTRPTPPAQRGVMIRSVPQMWGKGDPCLWSCDQPHNLKISAPNPRLLASVT